MGSARQDLLCHDTRKKEYRDNIPRDGSNKSLQNNWSPCDHREVRYKQEPLKIMLPYERLDDQKIRRYESRSPKDIIRVRRIQLARRRSTSDPKSLDTPFEKRQKHVTYTFIMGILKTKQLVLSRKWLY